MEREFGRLKHEYGLAFLRVRGIERVRLHAVGVLLLAVMASAITLIVVGTIAVSRALL